MISLIWHELKYSIMKNIREFALLVMAFTCSCVAINITLTNLLETGQEIAADKESYGDEVFYKFDLNGEDSVYQRVLWGDEYLESTKDIFEELNKSQDFKYLYRIGTDITFRDKTAQSTKEIRYPNDAYVGADETGNNYDLILKGFLADKLFCDEKNIAITSGKSFSEEDFYVSSPENMELPVILGADYMNMYKVGDTIEHANIWGADDVTLKVKGLFGAGSYFYDNNNEKICLDTYMVIPDAKPLYSIEQEKDKDNCYYRETYSHVLMNARIICKKENAKKVRTDIYKILHRHELYEMKLFDETGGAVLYTSVLKDLSKSSGVITLFMLVLGIIMFSMQSYYKLMRRKKTYAVYILNGITKKQILTILVLEALLVFAASDMTYMIFYVFNQKYPLFVWGITKYTIPVIIGIQIVSLILMTSFEFYQMNKMQMVTCLREHE